MVSYAWASLFTRLTSIFWKVTLCFVKVYLYIEGSLGSSFDFLDHCPILNTTYGPAETLQPWKHTRAIVRVPGSLPALSPEAGRGCLWWTGRQLSRGGSLRDPEESPEERLVELIGVSNRGASGSSEYLLGEGPWPPAQEHPHSHILSGARETDAPGWWEGTRPQTDTRWPVCTFVHVPVPRQTQTFPRGVSHS